MQSLDSLLVCLHTPALPKHINPSKMELRVSHWDLMLPDYVCVEDQHNQARHMLTSGPTSRVVDQFWDAHPNMTTIVSVHIINNPIGFIRPDPSSLDFIRRELSQSKLSFVPKEQSNESVLDYTLGSDCVIHIWKVVFLHALPTSHSMTQRSYRPWGSSDLIAETDPSILSPIAHSCL